MIETYRVAVSPTGAAGSAAGNKDSDAILRGILLAIFIDFTSEPATTDVTITTKGSPVRTILTSTNSSTDTWFDIRVQAKDTAGAAIAGAYDRIPLNDYVNVAVAQGDQITNGVVVYFLIDNLRG